MEVFAAEHWGRRPLLRRGAVDWSDVFSIGDIEHLLLTGARTPTFRLVEDGVALDPARSTRPVRLGGRVVDDAADVERIGQCIAGGATLVAQGLQRTWMPVVRICRALERATSHAVQANAYLTPAGANGLREHHDDHDVIVVQLEGSKHWRIDGLGEVDLDVGDVVYLPAGTRHSATAQSRPSLHLTIGLLTTSIGAVVHRVLDEVGGVLDDPLPLGFADPGGVQTLRRALEEALVHVTAALASVDLDAVVDREVGRARRRRRPLLTGHLSAVLGAGEITAASRVCLRPDTVASLVDGEDGATVCLRLRDRELTFPAVGSDAIRLLLRGDPVTVASLPGIDDDSKVVVARRLVREAVLDLVG